MSPRDHRSRVRLRVPCGVMALVLAVSALARAQIIDRVLAVVDGEIITLSDVRAALRFQLVPADVSSDPIAAALQRLVDRRLMLAEVERYAPGEPAAEAIDAGMGAIAARFPDALAFEIALNQSVMSRDELRRFVRDSLRSESYLRQRFATLSQPAEQDLASYYREHVADFTATGVLRPLDEVREQVRERVAAERRAAFVRDWLEGLRRRGNVVILYLPGRPGGSGLDLQHAELGTGMVR